MDRPHIAYTRLPTTDDTSPPTSPPQKPQERTHTSLGMELASIQQRQADRYEFAKRIVDHAVPFTEDHYIDLQALYPVHGGAIVFEILVPHIAYPDKYSASQPRPTFTDDDTFCVYVNIMNMEKESSVKRHIDMFMYSMIYSFETIQAFALYAREDPRNIVTSINHVLGTLTYWMRIPNYNMTLRDAKKVHDMITSKWIRCDHDNIYEFNRRNYKKCTDFYLFMDTFLETLRTTSIGRMWYNDELKDVIDVI